ncbi:creatinine amidohydrolase [Halobacteriales archaeon QS_4_62_28]|nr:MAG: creatinine amidohydrolase [Halobacteriales archaeon QS_4_62_28]
MVQERIGAAGSAWAAMTYREIQSIGGRDGSILVVPVGSIEQHGHHLPVATDTILVDAIADLGTDRVADSVPILKTPPFWSGFSPHHMAFGGTITLDFSVMLQALGNIADSALENDFDALLLLNGHGGNKALISAAVSVIGDTHEDVQVLGLTYFELASQFIDEIRESDIGGMSHGGEFETSLMLSVHPDFVDEDALDAPALDEPYELGTQDLLEGGPLAVYRGFEEYSATGAIGAPELASAEKGDAIYQLLGDEMESLLLDIHENVT